MYARGFGAGVGRMGGRFAGHQFARPGIGFFPLGGLVFFLFTALLVALMVVAFWRIFDKAGFPGVLGLLMLVPLVNVGMMLYLGLVDWPVLKRLRALEPAPQGAAGPVVAPPEVTAPPVVAVAEPEPPVEPAVPTDAAGSPE